MKEKSLAKIEDKIEASKTSLRSPTGTAIKRAIMLLIVLNLPKLKNSYSFGNLHVNGCKYKGWCWDFGGPEAYALHLVHNLVLRE